MSKSRESRCTKCGGPKWGAGVNCRKCGGYPYDSAAYKLYAEPSVSMGQVIALKGAQPH